MSLSSVFRVLAAAVALWASGVAQAQLPGLFNGLPGDDLVAPAASDQVAPHIAPGASARLAVWADERANPYVYNEYETSFDIYGVRLAADGTALDAVPIAIYAGRGSQSAPKAAWNGSEWLVVFRTTSLSGTGFFYASSLAAVRVAADGTVLDADPIPLPGIGSSVYAVASDGGGWVVAAQGNETSGDIVALRVSAQGEVLDPPTVTLVPEGDVSGSGIQLANAGGVFMLAYGTSVGTGTVLFDGQLFPLSAQQSLLDGARISALAGMPGGFYIAWNQQRPDFTLTIMGSRVGLDGRLLDGAGVDLAGAAAPFGNLVSAAWDGLDWRIGWESGGALRLARVNPDGALQNPGGTSIASVVPGPMAGTGAGGVQLVWSAFANNEYDVLGATIDAADVLLAGGEIATGQPRQHRADIAAGASGYLLAYRSEIAGEAAVLIQALDAAGQAVGLPLELDRGATLNGPGSPAVAWNGTHYLVSWATPGGIVALRVNENAVPVDAAPALVMNPGFGPVDVAALNGDFLVVGRRFGFTVQTIFPIGARVSGAGQLLDASPILLGDSSVSPFTVYALETVVATVGGRWLAAWHTNATHDDPLGRSVGVFFDPELGKGEPFEIAGIMSSNGGNGIHRIALGSSGSNALFARSRELSSGVENDMELYLIDSAGAVAALGNATPWSGNQYRPSISFDGRDYLIAFQDQKNRLAAQTLDQLDSRSDLYGMRVAVDGTVIDPQGFLIDDSPLAETDPAISSRGSDTLIAAAQMRNDGVASNYRIALADVLDGADRFPVAVAGASTRSGDVPLAVGFDAAGSKDPEGGAISYRWDFGDGNVATAPNPTHTFTTPGEYPVLLTVTDATGRTASQAIMVAASAPNIPPVAAASASALSGPVPLSVILSADGSYDPDGALGNIEWVLSDGRHSFGTPAFFTFNAEGSYTATLRVFDSRGAVGEDTLTIVAGGPNQPPVAMASAQPSSGDAPLVVSFSASGSKDVDGSIVSYLWDFGDGSSGSGASPSHAYASLGTFTATLTVTDNSGASATASVDVSVIGHSSRSLLASIDLSATKQRGTSLIAGAVNVVNGSGVAERSVFVTVQWTRPDGSLANQGQYTDRRGVASFSIANSGDGTYSLRVINAILAGSLLDPLASEMQDSLTLGGGGGDTTPPARPTGLVAVAGDGSVSLDWADNGEADLAGYHVERSEAGGPFARISGNGVGASQFADGGLVNGVTYTYRVIAFDTSGNQSATSDPASATPQGGATATTLHVGTITLGTANAGKGVKAGVASVGLVDDAGGPVVGATVTGEFTGSYAEVVQAPSGSDGVATLQTSGTQKGGVSFGFCVTGVQHPSLSYDAGANVVSCGQF